MRNVDRGMSAFRAVTGEEESATAIIHALQRRKYSGSKLLNSHDHQTKSAVIPFLDALAAAVSEAEPLIRQPAIEVDTKQSPKRLRIRVTVRGPDGKDYLGYPDPPLGFTVSRNGELDSFVEVFQSLATARSAASFTKLIKNRANYRNRLIYADAQGVPKIAGPIDRMLLRRRDHIYRNLTIFLLIDQYSEHQLFVEQALNAFLLAIKRMSKSSERE